MKKKKYNTLLGEGTQGPSEIPNYFCLSAGLASA